MDSHSVCFLDSGVGGLPYLGAAREYLPGFRLIYVADREYYPFGTKDPGELRRHLVRRVREVIGRFAPTCIVLACNTATVVALSHLREQFAIPFVGVVPAIKPAAEHTNGRRIAVLATSRTVREQYVADLVGRFASDREVVAVERGPTVDFVEERWVRSSPEERTAAAKEALSSLDAETTKAVVLGCTHFVFLRPYMEALLPGDVKVVDSVEGVARQIGRVCGNGIEGSSSEAPDLLVVTGSGPTPEGYAELSREFGLQLQQGL